MLNTHILVTITRVYDHHWKITSYNVINKMTDPCFLSEQMGKHCHANVNTPRNRIVWKHHLFLVILK
jgi:hypothetical protein